MIESSNHTFSLLNPACIDLTPGPQPTRTSQNSIPENMPLKKTFSTVESHHTNFGTNESRNRNNSEPVGRANSDAKLSFQNNGQPNNPKMKITHNLPKGGNLYGMDNVGFQSSKKNKFKISSSSRETFISA